MIYFQVPRVKIVPVFKFKGDSNRHKYWLVKDFDTEKNYATKDSATEAIHYVEEEGMILMPD